MKRTFLKTIVTVCFTWVIAFGASTAGAFSLSIIPGNASVAKNDSLTFSIKVNIDNNDPLVSADLNIGGFDSSILDFTGVEGNSLPSGWSSIPDPSLHDNPVVLSLLADPGSELGFGDHILVKLNFSAVGQGETTLSLDGNLVQLNEERGATSRANVSVSQGGQVIPEPSTFVLMAVAGLGLLGWRRLVCKKAL